MFDVEIALTPAILFGVYRFGMPALRTIILAVLASVVSEYIFQKKLRDKVTITDGSAIVTGLLLACVLSPAVPVYVPILGAIFATIVVVDLFGGYGRHWISPALAANGLLLISYQAVMANFKVDGVSGATSLTQMAAGEKLYVMDMFLGNVSGAIGEISVACLLIGAAYLIIRKRIDVIIPVIFLAVFAVFIAIFSGKASMVNNFTNYILAELFSGGLVFAAVFFAADYVICPQSMVGKIIFAVLLGIISGLFRVLGTASESVAYAVMFSTLFVPLIDKYTSPKEAEGKEAA
ncbi:MAG: RnfABCDGE type electron transport complex subunit D [Lachnospiraceae bacterium]|nr:RnfABCDGE type electron transport complex subunit D [Lachnospiraceae bacterium]